MCYAKIKRRCIANSVVHYTKSYCGRVRLCKNDNGDVSFRGNRVRSRIVSLCLFVCVCVDVYVCHLKCIWLMRCAETAKMVESVQRIVPEDILWTGCDIDFNPLSGN